MRDLGRARGQRPRSNPGNSVLAITLGALIIVPALVSMWRTSDRIQRTEEVAVDWPANGPIIFILLLLIGPVGIWYAASELNKAWRAQAGGGTPAGLPPTEPAAAPPPPPAPAEPRPEAPTQGPQAPPQ